MLAGPAPRWVRDVVDSVLRVRKAGVDVQGICLYPIVDMPDWHTGEWMSWGCGTWSRTGRCCAG